MITVGSINQSDLHEHEDIIASSISYPRFHYLYCHLSDEASIPLVRCTKLSSNVNHLKVVGAIPYLDELNSEIPDDAVVFSGGFSNVCCLDGVMSELTSNSLKTNLKGLTN